MEYNEDDYLLISGIQHFCFCRRQWALIHIEQQWTENVFTTSGRLVHNRVHDRDITDIRGGIITVRGLRISSAVLGITGECDAVEFIPAEEGISLTGREGKWIVRPVEYKNGSSKFNDCDRLQTTAQVICLEEMFSCEITQAAIFYNTTKRREKLIITDELRNKLREIIKEMRTYYEKGYTPTVKISKKCNSCSLNNLCLPELLKKRAKENVKDYISAALHNNEL